eukprot:EG_transcript_36803
MKPVGQPAAFFRPAHIFPPLRWTLFVNTLVRWVDPVLWSAELFPCLMVPQQMFDACGCQQPRGPTQRPGLAAHWPRPVLSSGDHLLFLSPPPPYGFPWFMPPRHICHSLKWGFFGPSHWLLTNH